MNPQPRNIVLLGFMGTGKTAVGRILARRLERRFVDLDQEVEEQAGCSIAELFATAGEEAFRRLEREAVRAVHGRSGLVVATGGGVVLDPRNLADLTAAGQLVCLCATPETLLDRVRHHLTRPLLQTPDPLARIRELLTAREPLYNQIPLRVATDDLTPEQVADSILETLGAQDGHTDGTRAGQPPATVSQASVPCR